MKKKFVKILSLILVFSLVMSVSALTACTDKTEQPRKLTSIEQLVVGKWNGPDPKNGGTYFNLNDNGTFDFYSPVLVPVDPNFPKGDHWYRVQKTDTGKFYHKSEGLETDGEGRGHYYTYIIRDNEWALFDIEPNKLYRLYGDEVRDFYYDRSVD